MRRLAFLLIGFAFTPAAPGADVPEKPILVLDADGHTALVKKVLFTPDGKELISVSDDKTIRVWDVQTGEPVRVLRPPIGRGKEGMLFAAALAPDGRTLAVGGYGWNNGNQSPIYLIGLATGRIERVLEGHPSTIFTLAFAPDGRRLASGSFDNTARIWDVATGRCERVLGGHTKKVKGVAFSPDGTRLATASLDTTGRIWDVATGRTAAVLEGHRKEVHCVAWSPDGKVVATGSYDHSIKFWGADGAASPGIKGLQSAVLSLTFSTDSRTLLFTWGGETADKIGAALLDLSTRRERVRFARHTNTVQCGSLSPDGTLAATAGGNDDEIHLWKTADATPVHRMASKGRTTWSAAWSPEGGTIAWGNTNHSTNRIADSPNAKAPLGRTFRLTDLGFAAAPNASFRRTQPTRGALSLASTGRTTVAVRQGDRTVATLAMSDPYEGIRCFTLLPGDHAAVGTDYGLYLFDTRSGKLVRSFLGHTGTVWAVAPSPNGRHMLSASGDQTLRVWDPDRDEPLLSLFFAGDEWIAWTPEGYYAASPGGEKLMGWHLNHGADQMATFYRASQFRKSLYRPDVVKLIPTTLSTERALKVADMAKGGKPSERVEVAAVLPPLVEIAAPRAGTRLTSPKLEVKAIAQGRGGRPVKALRLLLDGRPYLGLAGVKSLDPPRSGGVQEVWNVVLEPGTHKIAVQADSDVSNAVSEPVEVIVDQEVQLPTLYVLSIGVAAYPGDLRLNYTAKDAEALAHALQEYSKVLFRKVEVRLLTDQKATRAEMSRGLTWLKQQMTQNDVGIVFFSGHVQKDAEGSLYLLPVDVDTNDLLTTAMPRVVFMNALAGMPGRVITLLDACHAGAIDGDRRKEGPGGLTDELVRDLATDDYGVIVMASSTGRESSLESNAQRQSYFTYALTEGLSGKADLNHDGVVYLNELDNYVTDRVKLLTKGQQHPVTAKPASIRSFPLAKP